MDGDINDNVQISHFLLVGWTNLKDITIFVVSTVHKSSIVYYNVKDTVNDTNPHESQQNEFVGVFVKKKSHVLNPTMTCLKHKTILFFHIGHQDLFIKKLNKGKFNKCFRTFNTKKSNENVFLTCNVSPQVLTTYKINKSLNYK